MIVRRRYVDTARSAHAVYRRAVNAWLADTTDRDAGLFCADALMAFCLARDALNGVELALFTCVKDRVYPTDRLELN